MMRIVHIITSLARNGAQNMLYRLCRYSDNKYRHEVISLMDEGEMGEALRKKGISVHCMNLGFFNFIGAVMKAGKICRDADIISTWLYHSDIFGFLTAKVLSKKYLIWNIRHGNLDRKLNKRSMLGIVKINAYISGYADCISYNSKSAYESHKRAGYSEKNVKLLSNGFELDIYTPEGQSLRKELGLGDETVIITIGRWYIQKDYNTLLKAVGKLRDKGLHFRLLMVGKGLDKGNKELMDMIGKYGAGDCVMLLGIRDDVPGLLSCADIYVSSSAGESFSNSIGEAMSAGLPCVVTDAGDSGDIVGDAGIVAGIGDYMALAEGLHSMIRDRDIGEYGKRAKERIKQYDIKRVVKMYEDMWDQSENYRKLK